MPNDYSELPAKIFGLTCQKHRASLIKEFFTSRKIAFRSKATKVDLLRQLVSTQKRFIGERRTIVSRFLQGKSAIDELHEGLRAIRKAKEQPKGKVVPEPKPERFSRSPRSGLAKSKSPTHGAPENCILQACPRYSRQLAEMERAAAGPAKRTAPKDPLITCTVCLSLLPRESFPPKKLTLACGYEQRTCIECLAGSLDFQIEQLPWDHVACPECASTLPYETVKNFAKPESFARFDMKALLSALDGFPGFIRCLGPNCGSGQIHPGRDKSPCMTCSTCKFKTCYTHQMPWHAAQTCAEFDAFRNRPKAELASAKYLAEKTVTCPNCGAHIEKDKGCDHMRCECGHEFCYVCLASFNDIWMYGSLSHSPNCKHYGTNTYPH